MTTEWSPQVEQVPARPHRRRGPGPAAPPRRERQLARRLPRRDVRAAHAAPAPPARRRDRRHPTTDPPTGPAALRRSEWILQALHEAGFTGIDLQHVHATLLTYTFGKAAKKSPGTSESQARSTLRPLSPSSSPCRTSASTQSSTPGRGNCSNPSPRWCSSSSNRRLRRPGSRATLPKPCRSRREGRTPRTAPPAAGHRRDDEGQARPCPDRCRTSTWGLTASPARCSIARISRSVRRWQPVARGRTAVERSG